MDRPPNVKVICTSRPSRTITLATLLLIGFTAPVVFPGAALAQKKAEDLAVEKIQKQARMAQAKEHYKAAEVLYRLGKFKEALEQYKAAYKLINSANLLFNMAQCYRMMGQVDDALFHFRSFRDDYRRDNDDRLPPNIEEVERLIVELKAKKVIAEDRAIAAEKLRQEKERSKEKLTLEQQRRKETLAREEKLRKEQLAREDKHRSDLKEIIKHTTTKKRVPMGNLVITQLDVDGAQVIVDSVPRAVAPVIKPIPLKPGKYRVQIRAAGYLDAVTAVEIKDLEDTPILVIMKPRPSKSRLWLASTITCFVLAAGAEAMGLVFMFEADKHYKDSPAFKDDTTLMYVGHGLAGGLGALAITSLVLYLTSDRVGEETSSVTSAGVTPLPGGAAFTGGFRF